MIFQNFCIRMKILNHGNGKKPNRREIIFLRLNRFLTKCICQNFLKLKKKFFYQFYFLVGGKYNHIPGVFFFSTSTIHFSKSTYFNDIDYIMESGKVLCHKDSLLVCNILIFFEKN